MFQRRMISKGGLIKQPEGFEFPVADLVNDLPMPDDVTAAGRQNHCLKVIEPRFTEAWNEFQGLKVHK